MEELSPYAGRWVALVGDRVVGVGYTAAEAEHLAQRNRPKDRFTLRYVEPAAGEPLALSLLLDEIRPLLQDVEMPVYLVGGAVRDALLGRPSHDLDFVVPAGAIRLAFRVADALGVPAFALDRERDTGRVVFPGEEATLDFARFRGPDLLADLGDRDFTINALALPATARTTASIIDPTGGLADLAARQIRPTHPGALASDPVRALRAVRLAHSLDFTLTTETKTAITAALPLLPNVSRERVRDELLKILLAAAPHTAVADLQALGLLAQTLPDVAALARVAQPAPHYEAVLPHTLHVLAWLVRLERALFAPEATAEERLQEAREALAPYVPALQAHLQRPVDGALTGLVLLRLGALFHDVGKRETQTVDDDGRVRFIGHDKVGAQMAARQLRRLALSNEAVTHVQYIVAGHMRPLLLAREQRNGPSRRAAYRYFRAVESAGLDIGLLALADHLAIFGDTATDDAWRPLLALVVGLYHFYFEQHDETVAPPPLLDGRDLMEALTLEPGPEIGRLLRLLEEAQAVGEVNTREEALRFVRQQHEAKREEPS